MPKHTAKTIQQNQKKETHRPVPDYPMFDPNGSFKKRHEEILAEEEKEENLRKLERSDRTTQYKKGNLDKLLD